MTNTPSERDGEPLGPPIIDEVHLFTPAVAFKRGLGRGFMISTSNAGPLKGTKMHAALEDFIQAEGPLKPGSYHYSAATGRWTKAAKSEDLQGISGRIEPKTVEYYVSETIRRKIAELSEQASMYAAATALPDPWADQIAAAARARLVPWNDMAKAVGLHGDEALKTPLYWIEEDGTLTPNTPSQEDQMPKPDPFNDTNTKAPADEQPIAERSPYENPDQIHVSKLIRTAGKRPTTLLFRIEVDPVAVSDDGRPCYQVSVPPTTTRVSQAPPRHLREVDIDKYLTSQYEFVDKAQQEIGKRAEETKERLDGIREELEIAAANKRGLSQIREEFLTQLADRQLREEAAKTSTDNEAPTPSADEISVAKSATYRRGQESQSVDITIAVDPWAQRDEEGNPAYLVTTPSLSDTKDAARFTIPEGKMVDFLTGRRKLVLSQHEAALKLRDETRKVADEAQKHFEIASLHCNILGTAINDFVEKRARREDRRAAEQELAIQRAQYRVAEPPRARSVWRPTMVTFVKHELDGDQLKRVRYTAVREMDENSWAIAGQRDRFTWDELLDWIQFEEDDLDKVMQQVRFQHLMDKVTYRAARNDVVPGFGWVEESRS
ncbi:hypothetical protein [Nocardia phage NC1]|nr:hypothetical protein [Nocardia phage NC1]QSL67780.1 hypothetical protein [Nocardia phage P69]